MEKSAKRQRRISDSAPSDWVRFGWQGISCLAPPDWSLGAIGGEYKQGYLRLDDGSRPRLEVRWNKQEADLSRTVDKYLKSLGKPRRGLKLRRNPAIAVKRDVRIVSQRAKPNKRMEGFAWSEGEGLHCAGVIWICKDCGRTVIAQVRSYGKEEVEALAREVLTTLEDHAEEGRNIWALYGLESEVPEGYALKSQSLMAGYLELAFLKGKRKLRISRWGLAENMLANTDLKEWFETRLARSKREIRWQAQAAALKNHVGLEITGFTRKIPQQLQRLALTGARRMLGKKAPLPAEGLGKVWYCPESNRIYLVECVQSPETGVLEEVTDSVICH
jgi:hypothetical protein